jgi:hypothetical protein
MKIHLVVLNLLLICEQTNVEATNKCIFATLLQICIRRRRSRLEERAAFEEQWTEKYCFIEVKGKIV